MAAENHGQNATVWELSKENVKPVKSGRSVSCIQAVLQPSEEDAERLMKEKQRFEEDIIAGELSEDPIAPWHRYLEWTIQNFPTRSNTKIITDLLSKFIGKFKGGQYNDDPRYVNAWLKLAEIMNDPLEIYSFMNTDGIGQYQAEYYIAWADEYEKYGDEKKANRIYSDGLTKCAVPVDLLEKRYVEFQLRLAKGSGSIECDSQEPEEADRNERVPFNQLETRERHGAVGSIRVGTAFKPLGNRQQTTKSKLPSQSGSWEIYEDKSDAVSVMGERGKWASIPSKSVSNENAIGPSKWNECVEHKRKVRQSHITPHYSEENFEIYEEENENVPAVRHRTVANVLTEKKDVLSDFSQIESVLHEKPVHDKKSKSYYDVDKVYTVMGEMQFEEVRAAIFRKKQRILAEQKHNLEQQRLEEEKALLRDMEQEQIEEERRLVKKKMELIEMEKRVMETQRLKMKQHKLDLENRLKEIKALEKTAITRQEAGDLHKEEEDITVQLGAVERKLRSAKLEQVKYGTLQCSNNLSQCVEEKMRSAGNYRQISNFDRDPNNIDNGEVQTITTGIQKELATGNNSLNHSRPSPTVNTKEAMNHISAWFQKSLEDDEFVDNSVCPNERRESIKPEPEPDKKRNAVDENADPFEIFVENSNDVPALTRSVKPKTGLSSRSFPSHSENEVMSSAESKDFTSHVEDKTNSVFDDVTVAGSHFAAQARMASTPAVSKKNALQYTQHIGNLSCIPSYQGMENFTPIAELHEKKQQSRFEYENVPHTDNPSIDEIKQLTPIMEDSKESERSTLKSAFSQSSHSVPTKQTSNSLSTSQIKSEALSAPLKTTSEGQQPKADESSDSLDDFSFWGVKCADTSNGEREPSIDRKTDDAASQQDGFVEAFQRGECTERCTEDSTPIVNTPSSSNIIHDPWDDNVLSGILQRMNPTIAQSDVSIVRKEQALPVTLKPGTCVELREKFKIGKVIGEGAFAKVYEVCHKELVMKAQSPPCPWEVYATTTVRRRLLNQGMYNAADAIINIDSAFFYDDCSLLLLPRFRKGTLLDAINTKSKTMVLKDTVAMWIAREVMSMVHALHTVGFIHGDIKPDNFMIVPNTDGEYKVGIKLIDFGRAIDMTQLPKCAMFTKDCGTSGFRCIQMKNGQPWNYHIDYYGIAGTLYVVLFGAYMNVKQSEDGLWRITRKLRRWNDATLWGEFFQDLINHPTPSEERMIGIGDSPLPKLLEKFEEKMHGSANVYSAVDAYFKGL